MLPRRIRASPVALVSALLGSATYVFAGPAPLWGQCGGIGYTGPTVCDSGAICVYKNPYFSNCYAAYLFSFGDSYTATGFSTTGAPPGVNNPIGNPTFPGKTFTGGTNWIGYLTETYNNSLVFAYNYASSGATIDANLVPQHSSAVQSMTDQVNTFLSTVASPANADQTPWSSGTGLFSIWIGINDIANTYLGSGDRGAFSDTLLNAEFALVQKLYDVGARNFLWANVPPVDRTPLMVSEGYQNQTTEKAIIEDFNNKLAAKIKQFQANNTGVTTFLWDANAQFSAILDSPVTYGFKDSVSFGNASDEFWGNDFHPSTYAHKLLGQQVGRIVLNGTYW